MRPTYTCQIIRRILQAIGSNEATDENGITNAVQPDPTAYSDPAAFKRAWLAYNVGRKRVVANSALKQKAIDTFLLSERKNAEVNSGEPLTEWAACYLLRARQICAEVLGKLSLDEIYRNATFTGGASTSRKRLDAHPAIKWWASPSIDVTLSALPHLAALKKSCEVLDAVWDMPGNLSCTTQHFDDRQAVKIVLGSRFDTVAKDATTDRTIIIEPDGNMLLQRGCGITIRKKLRSVGIDLQRQDHNQELARRASLNNKDATVDVRNASNSNSMFLACAILDDDWYELCLDLRSALTRMPDGTVHRLEMISSMGNGYTFELETLLYYCLTKAVVDVDRPESKTVSIYGDDIVLPSSCVTTLRDLFSEFGIEINLAKSFWDGPFRESCGAHWYQGVDVKPFYIKEDVTSDSDLFRIINAFHMWCTGDYAILPSCKRQSSCLKWLVSLVGKRPKPQVPLEYSNTCGLYSPLYSTAIKHRRNKKGWTVLVFQYYTPVTRPIPCDEELLWLYHHMSSPGSNPVWQTSSGCIRFSPNEKSPRPARDTGKLRLRTVSIPYAGMRAIP